MLTGQLARLAVRQLRSHPWQLGLAILGIALGVAVAVSIDLANASALRAFRLSTEAVSGRATHQIVGGPSGVPEDLYRRLRLELGVRRAAPIVEGDVALTGHADRTLHVLGIDPFVDADFRPYLDGQDRRDARGRGAEIDARGAETAIHVRVERAVHRLHVGRDRDGIAEVAGRLGVFTRCDEKAEQQPGAKERSHYDLQKRSLRR